MNLHLPADLSSSVGFLTQLYPLVSTLSVASATEELLARTWREIKILRCGDIWNQWATPFEAFHLNFWMIMQSLIMSNSPGFLFGKLYFTQQWCRRTTGSHGKWENFDFHTIYQGVFGLQCYWMNWVVLVEHTLWWLGSKSFLNTFLCFSSDWVVY